MGAARSSKGSRQPTTEAAEDWRRQGQQTAEKQTAEAASTGNGAVVARSAEAAAFASTGDGAVVARSAEAVNSASTGGSAESARSAERQASICQHAPETVLCFEHGGDAH